MGTGGGAVLGPEDSGEKRIRLRAAEFRERQSSSGQYTEVGGLGATSDLPSRGPREVSSDANGLITEKRGGPVPFVRHHVPTSVE